MSANYQHSYLTTLKLVQVEKRGCNMTKTLHMHLLISVDMRRYVMAELRLEGGVVWFDKVCD
jgi:hypothetical protein